MRYVILLKSAQPPTPPPPALMDAIMKLGEDATAAGALVDTAGLAPSGQGTRITVAGGALSATDGPFAEAKEVISYAIYDVRSKEEAVEWTNRFMAAHRDLWPGWEGEADVLKVFSPEDFLPAS
jgi:hypothetical protein